MKQQRKLLLIFIKTRISSLIQAILPLSIEAAPIQKVDRLISDRFLCNSSSQCERVTGIRTVALIKEQEGGLKPRKTEVNIKRKQRIGNYFANPSRPTTPDSYPVAIYLSRRASIFSPIFNLLSSQKHINSEWVRLQTFIDFPLQAWAKSSLSTHLVNREACTTANFNHISKHGQ